MDVTSHNSTERYKGKAVDVRQVGKELNVRYVLEGSVQRDGDQRWMTLTASPRHHRPSPVYRL